MRWPFWWSGWAPWCSLRGGLRSTREGSVDMSEDWWEATGGSRWESDADVEPNLVRPYTLTAGRTDSRVHLPLEAPVETLPTGTAPEWPGNDVRGQILAMCVDSPSVAEIAAH